MLVGKQLQKCRFKCLLVKAVDESLSFLGDSAKCSIYFHLETSFGMKREEIPKKPEVFAEKLEELFKEGSCYIKRLILKRLYESAGLELKCKKGYSFTDYINEVKEFLDKQAENKVEERLLKCGKKKLTARS